MEDLVSKLKDFSKLSFQSKLEIIARGRPTPDLKDLLQTSERKNRSFQKEWYSRKE